MRVWPRKLFTLMPPLCSAGHLSIHENDIFLYGRKLVRQQTKYIMCSVDSRQSDGFSNIGYEWELEKEGKVKILEQVAHSWLLRLYLPEMWSPGLYINLNSGSFELPVLGTVYPLGLLKINCCLTYSLTTLNSSISTILLVHKVTQHGIPKRDSSQPYQWVQYFAATRATIAPIFCVSLVKNRNGPKWQALGPITTSVGPLCFPGLILLIKAPDFWKFKCHSWHHSTASYLLMRSTCIFWWQLLCFQITWYTPSNSHLSYVNIY